MKYYFTFYLLLICLTNVDCQEYFVKVNKGSDITQEKIYSLNLLDNNNILAYIKKGCAPDFDRCPEIIEFNANGEIQKQTNLSKSWLNTQKIIVYGDTCVIIGNYVSDPDTLFIHTRLINGDSLAYYKYSEPVKKYTNIYPHAAIKYKNKYVMAGTARYREPIDSILFIGIVFYFNQDFKLDTIIEFNFGNYSNKIHDLAIDDSNLLTLLTTVAKKKNDSSLCIYTIINKNIDSEKCWEQKPRTELIKIIKNNQSTIVLKSDPNGNSDYTFALNEAGEIAWTNYFGAKASYVTLIDLINTKSGDILTFGQHEGKTVSDIVNGEPAAFLTKVNKDGKTLWQRTYLNLQNDKAYTQEYITDVVEMPNKDIIIGGAGNEVIVKDGVSKVYDRVLFGKVDQYGCLEEDRCNDVVNIGLAPADSLYLYDQLTTKGKQWYYTVTEKDGQKKILKNEFSFDKADISLYNGKPDDFSVWKLYRKLLNIFTDTSIESDYILNWHHNGTSYIKHKREVLITVGTPHQYDSLLYDFRLKTGDIFTFPAKYGKAKVVVVDSINLLDGYTRKRIVLRHQDPDNQKKYGDLTWIEGIGSTNGLIYFLDWQNGTKTTLNCYFDRDKKRYGQAPNCEDVYTSTKETNEASVEKIKVIPNPFENEVTLSFSQMKGISRLEIQVFGMDGVKVYEKNNVKSNSISITTRDWSRGLYIVKITNSDGQSYFEKIVKQ